MPIPHFRRFAECNILTTQEVAEKLEITRQRVNALVKSGALIPFKQTPATSLFFLVDIEHYLETRKPGPLIKANSINSPFLRPEYASTHHSEEFFHQNIDKLSDISAIFIYFDHIDAAIDNFYLPSRQVRYGNLYLVDTPAMIIRDFEGKEMWLDGCTCGYAGEGPHGSERILRYLGISAELAENVFKFRVVKFFKEINSSFDAYCHDSPFDHPFIHKNTANLYLSNGQLVLTQSPGFNNTDSLAVLKNYKTFIPNPHEIVVFPSYKMAKEMGFVAPGFRSEEIYTVIVKDASGRELWLNPYLIPDIPAHRQDDFKAVLESCGFDIPEEVKGNTIKNFLSWLSIKPRRVAPEAISFKRRS